MTTEPLYRQSGSRARGNCAHYDTGHDDDRRYYDDEQLTALVALIAGINAWNRLNVITRQPAGSYQPGQWA